MKPLPPVNPTDTFVGQMGPHTIYLRGQGYGYYYNQSSDGAQTTIVLYSNGDRPDWVSCPPEVIDFCKAHHNLSH